MVAFTCKPYDPMILDILILRKDAVRLERGNALSGTRIRRGKPFYE